MLQSHPKKVENSIHTWKHLVENGKYKLKHLVENRDYEQKHLVEMEKQFIWVADCCDMETDATV